MVQVVQGGKQPRKGKKSPAGEKEGVGGNYSDLLSDSIGGDKKWRSTKARTFRRRSHCAVRRGGNFSEGKGLVQPGQRLKERRTHKRTDKLAVREKRGENTLHLLLGGEKLQRVVPRAQGTLEGRSTRDFLKRVWSAGES